MVLMVVNIFSLVDLFGLKYSLYLIPIIILKRSFIPEMLMVYFVLIEMLLAYIHLIQLLYSK